MNIPPTVADFLKRYGIGQAGQDYRNYDWAHALVELAKKLEEDLKTLRKVFDQNFEAYNVAMDIKHKENAELAMNSATKNLEDLVQDAFDEGRNTSAFVDRDTAWIRSKARSEIARLKEGEMKKRVPITQLDGYQAAAVLTEKALNKAEKTRPILAGWKLNRRSSEYRQGYYDGLMLAHCLDVLGKFPEHNRKQILKALSL